MTLNEREAFEEAYLSVGGKQRELELEDGEYTNSKSQLGWELWKAAKAQAVPDTHLLVKKEETESWFFEEDEGYWYQDTDWLCDLPVGEVKEVRRKCYMIIEDTTEFAAITWDEENNAVGYYEIYSTKEEAENAAQHCKEMIEASESGAEG